MKIAPFIRAVEAHNDKAAATGEPRLEHILVHTGQHYDDKMSRAFVEYLSALQYKNRTHEILQEDSMTNKRHINCQESRLKEDRIAQAKYNNDREISDANNHGKKRNELLLFRKAIHEIEEKIIWKIMVSNQNFHGKEVFTTGMQKTSTTGFRTHSAFLLRGVAGSGLRYCSYWGIISG
jgi:hypothetical protein